MKKTLQDITEYKNTHLENDLILVKNQESLKLVNNINSIYEALISNKDITKQTLQEIIKSIQENFKNSQIDLYGTTVDIPFIKKHEKEIQENKDIWQEIVEGDFDNIYKLTFLIPSVSYSLSQFQQNILNLNTLQSIDKDSTTALAQFNGKNLSLNGLQSINPETAFAFSQFKGQHLSLNGIQSIDKYSALALSQFQGKSLTLNGLQSIDKDSVLALNKFKGKLEVSNEVQKQIHSYAKENKKIYILLKKLKNKKRTLFENNI
jgi:hypothetical protein